ncbi:MAG TPA: hypothetical protein VGO46_00045 [Gemmatimonadaceae bacterium]|jgi:hypothetical protein|nr:hypothetical protein [Gemmatimonadaceae bacterium]
MVPAVLARIIARKSMSNPALMTTAPAPWIIVGVIGLVSLIIADSLLLVTTSDAYLQGEVDLARTFRATARRIFAAAIATFIRYLMVFGILIVVSVVLAVGLMAFVHSGAADIRLATLFVTPIAVLIVSYPLFRTFSATAIVMLEGSGGSAAVGRSFRLSKDYAKHIVFSLGLSFLLYLAATAISAVLTMRFLTPTTAGIVQSLVVIPILPFYVVVKTLLYYDLRVRKEGFDLEVSLRELGTGARETA